MWRQIIHCRPFVTCDAGSWVHAWHVCEVCCKRFMLLSVMLVLLRPLACLKCLEILHTRQNLAIRPGQEEPHGWAGESTAHPFALYIKLGHILNTVMLISFPNPCRKYRQNKIKIKKIFFFVLSWISLFSKHKFTYSLKDKVIT